MRSLMARCDKNVLDVSHNAEQFGALPNVSAVEPFLALSMIRVAQLIEEYVKGKIMESCGRRTA